MVSCGMRRPARNRPSICLSCSHYSHLARLSTLFFTIFHTAQTLNCCQCLSDLGFNSQHSLEAAFIANFEVVTKAGRTVTLERLARSTWQQSCTNPFGMVIEWIRAMSKKKKKYENHKINPPFAVLFSLALSFYYLVVIPVWVKCTALQAT